MVFRLNNIDGYDLKHEFIEYGLVFTDVIDGFDIFGKT